MKINENGLFIKEGAYQWARNKAEKFPQQEKTIDLDSFKNIGNIETYDLETFLFESPICPNEHPLIMLRKLNDDGTLSTATHKLNRKAYESFKKQNPEFTNLLLMNGRIAYRKALIHKSADLPKFKINIPK